MGDATSSAPRRWKGLHRLLARVLPMPGRHGPRGNALPEAFLDEAHVPGYGNIRFWGDAYSPAFERTLIEKNHQVREAAEAGVSEHALDEASFLAISGGGDKGAFAAGVLAGWSERGTRPVFEAVCGVSAGALASPFAFLGASEDKCLHHIYTENGSGELYKSRGIRGFFSDALNDTARLDELIHRYVTEDFLDRIAVEHRKGRRLFVMTTNLDAQRQVIWSLSEVAASAAPDRRDLFAKVLRASSALPGLFPPVEIAVTGPDGKTYNELHVDGGVTAELIFVPPEARILAIEGDIFPKRRQRFLYVIENGKLGPEYNAIDPEILPLSLRAIATTVKFQVIDNLLALARIAKEHDEKFFFNAIPQSFDMLPRVPFDRVYAKHLFAAGREVGRAGRWCTVPPVTPALVRPDGAGECVLR